MGQSYLHMGEELSAKGLRVICKWVKWHFATKCSPHSVSQYAGFGRGSWRPVVTVDTQCVSCTVDSDAKPTQEHAHPKKTLCEESGPKQTVQKIIKLYDTESTDVFGLPSLSYFFFYTQP